MKFPYGICDFREIVAKGYFYCDRTDRIPLLERGKYQLFIRPRRFGKSLLLSMLSNYYDMAKADEFETLFGGLEIGKSPTSLRNRYFILKWDFSCVDSSGDARETKRALHDHINACVKRFEAHYGEFLTSKIEVDPHNAINSIESLVTSVHMTEHPVYLLIDEYDNFANELVMGVQGDGKRKYEALVYEEGPLRTLFKVVKSSTGDSLFDRIFIVGVSPAVMSDIAGGYNIATNIYLKPAFNDLCGFTHAEAERAVRTVAEECELQEPEISEALDTMRTWYDGYKFSPGAKEPVYNPTLALYFADSLAETCAYPRIMLDSNLAMDAAKLDYISRIPAGGQLLLNLMREDHRTTISQPADRFGIREMLDDQSKDRLFMISFLYYFGVLTVSGLTEAGEVSMKVPNLAVKKLYVEKIQSMLLPEPSDRDEGMSASRTLWIPKAK